MRRGPKHRSGLLNETNKERVSFHQPSRIENRGLVVEMYLRPSPGMYIFRFDGSPALFVIQTRLYSESLFTLVFHKLCDCIKELLAFAEEKKDVPALKGKQARAWYACMHLFR